MVVDRRKLSEVTERLKTEVLNFPTREEAERHASKELIKIVVRQPLAQKLAVKLVDKYWVHRQRMSQASRARVTTSQPTGVGEVRRKEAGTYWSVTTPEGTEEFMKGLRALQEMRRGFHTDAEWASMDLKAQYKFLDHIEDILKNPGKYRDNEDYETIKVALITRPSTAGESIDKIEEAALMALGVLKRRRGSEKQIARMGPERREQRREAREKIETYWSEGGGSGGGGGREQEQVPIPFPPGRPTPTPTPTPSPTPTPIPVPHQFTLIIESYPLRHSEIKIDKFKDRNDVDEPMITGAGFRPPALVSAIVTFLPEFNSKKFTDKEKAKKWLVPKLAAIGFDQYRAEAAADRIIELANIGEAESAQSTMYWRGHGPNLDPYGRNLFTPFEVQLPAGKYLISMPLQPQPLKDMSTEHLTGFNRFEVRKRSGTQVFSRYEPYPGHTEKIYMPGYSEDGVYAKLTIEIDENNMKITGIYTSPDIKRGNIRPRESYSGYLAGSPGAYRMGGASGVRGAADTGGAALGSRVLGGRMTRDVKQSSMGTQSELAQKYKDKNLALPRLRAAVTRGKDILNGYAKAEYRRLFDPLEEKYGKKGYERVALKNSEIKAKQAQKNARRWIRQSNIKRSWLKQRLGNAMDVANEGQRIAEAGGASGLTVGQVVMLKNCIQAMRDFENMRNRYYEQLEHDINTAAEGLRRYLKDKAGSVTKQLARRYRIPINSDEEKALSGELDSYTQEIAEEFVARGRTPFFTALRGIRGISGGLQTAGDVYYNLLHNLWTLITGPWTIGGILLFITMFFMITWVGYNPLLLFVMPVAGAVFVLLLNFTEVNQPLDWLVHLICGGLIAYCTIIFMFSLGMSPEFFSDSWTGGAGFWIVGALLFGLIGVMQFYQAGGYKIAFQLTIVMLLFGYFALGPYQIYWQTVKDQVKEPLKIAYRSLERAFTDVYLLATNPTEFYARQQLVNVRPEKPISYPRAVELTSIEALPPSVPSGESFAVVAIMKNEGEFKATEIKAIATCNQFCEKIQDPTGFTDTMDKKDSQIINYPLFVAKGLGGSRQAELQRGIVTLNVSYRYSTNSSLLVTISSPDEIRRKQFGQEDVFKPVLAVAKVGPAQLSLNVGPQPLQGSEQVQIPEAPRDKTGLLLVSVSNARPDGSIFLQRHQKIKIHMPAEVGTIAVERCSGQIVCIASGEETICSIEPYDASQNVLEIKQYEFQSIFAFLCPFSIPIVENSRSGLVTATLTDYRFELAKKKDVPVTAPLGIILDPNDYVCKACGKGLTNICTKSVCHSISKPGNFLCWYQDRGAAVLLENTCRVCGGQFTKCADFYKETWCDEAKNQCGWQCEWDSNAINPNLPADQNRGMCVGAGPPTVPPTVPPVVPPIPPTVPLTVSCDDLGITDDMRDKYNQFSGVIKTAVVQENIGNYDNQPAALMAALITHESAGWQQDAISPCAAVGFTQLMPGTASDMGIQRIFEDSRETSCKNIGPYLSRLRAAVSGKTIAEKTAIDERFDGTLNIQAGTKYFGQGLQSCGSVVGALRKYNSGQCAGTASYSSTYHTAILAWRDKWTECFGRQQMLAQQQKDKLMGVTTNTELFAVVQYGDMASAASKEGITIESLSGFMSFDDQLKIWNDKFNGAMPVHDENGNVVDMSSFTDDQKISAIARYSAVPGMSRHHWATEIDICSVDNKDFEPGEKCEAVYNWLLGNANQYGFCQTYDQYRGVVAVEKWHWSYSPIASRRTAEYVQLITADDFHGKSIAGEDAIANDFTRLRNGFVSDVNPACGGAV